MVRSALRDLAPRGWRYTFLVLALATAPAVAAQTVDAGAKVEAASIAKDSAALSSKWGNLPARWQFAAGGFLPSLSTTASFGGPILPPTTINFENRLGMSPHTQTLDLYASYRFKKKNMFSLEYFGYNRTGSSTIQDSLVVNDSVYHAGLTVDAHALIEYYGFTYRYYLWRRQRWELGVGLGIDVLNLSSGVGIKANVNAKQDSAGVNGSIVAPVPLLGLYADWQAAENIYIRGAFQMLKLTYEAYSGQVHDRRIAAEWYPLKNYGLGLGWHYVGLGIRKTDSNTQQYVQLGYSIQGLALYATAAFGAPQPVAARVHAPWSEPPDDQKFGLVPRTALIFLGAYAPSVNSRVELTNAAGVGSDVDAEHKLGLPNRVTSVDLGAVLRINNKSLLTFSYFSFSRSGSATLSDSIVVGNDTLHAGATVDAGGRLAYLGFSYRYYFLRKRTWQLGAGLGFDELDMQTNIGIKATVAGRQDSLEHTSSLSAPAPMLGLYADWNVINRVYLRASGQYISLTIDTIGGSISDDRVSAEWYAFKDYGIGFGYHYVNVDARKTLPGADVLSLKYTIEGLNFYLMAAF